MAASSQRATTLGMETRLAAPFGAKALVRRRGYGGAAEPGKPDDLAPRWLDGRYLGPSETVHRGHVVKIVHTVNIRVGHEDHPLPDPDHPLPDPELEAGLAGPPSRRIREEARGSGDVAAVSKGTDGCWK